MTRKTRILDVSYNASNNELVRTQTLVKNAIVQVRGTGGRVEGDVGAAALKRGGWGLEGRVGVGWGGRAGGGCEPEYRGGVLRAPLR